MFLTIFTLTPPTPPPPPQPFCAKVHVSVGVWEDTKKDRKGYGLEGVKKCVTFISLD